MQGPKAGLGLAGWRSSKGSDPSTMDQGGRSREMKSEWKQARLERAVQPLCGLWRFPTVDIMRQIHRVHVKHTVGGVIEEGG